MSSQQQRYPHTPPPSPASVIGRQLAGQMAPSDTAKALKAARACPDAWYRVQALASVAEYAEGSAALSILEEAAREAQSCHDAYGAVAVMAWPIGAAFKLGQHGYAGRELKKCLQRAADIEPRASQAYALEILWHACLEHPGHANAVWHRILELCHPDRNWRAARLYLHIAEIQHERHGDAATIIRALPPGKTRSWLERRFQLG